MRISLALFASLLALFVVAGPGVRASGHADAVVDSAATRPDIVMYVIPNCGYCEKTRQLLSHHDLQWREVDIESSTAAKKTFVSLGGVGTPLLVIGNESVQGFDTARIEAFLARNGAIER